jgi:catechol 2,3-dioxygenase-like lactoylglutathione lyase family enzyme
VIGDGYDSAMRESPAAAGARFGHVNVIARDWRALVAFYESVFGCVPVPPERDYRGEIVERGTAVPRAAFRGVHLRLPGHGPDGPTLEIYTYHEHAASAPPVANRLGWGHVAFMVDDVAEASAAVLEAGGSQVGEIVTTQIADGRRVTWCYMADPEGNLVELQSWSSPSG